MYQMIGRSYGVVPVGLDALDGVFIFEFVLFLHDFEDCLIVRHFLLTREEAADAFFLRQFKPRVCTDVFYGVAGIWVGVQNLSQEVCTL